ncbi:hypothetical protein PQX77_013075 [Marasmius sp. AFHP31]|nr:hypothetical protein PQX77_013075 [Marasmius sp. AFHP31]
MPSLLRACCAAGPAPPFNERPRLDTPFTYAEIFDVVSAASIAAQKAGYGCYLFGSAAVYFTCPNHRTPEDIDLAIFRLSATGRPTRAVIDAEQVKVDIQRQDPHFYRVVAEEPGATHTAFWFSFSNDPQGPAFTMSIRIDVVPAGSDDLKLPLVPWSKLMWTFQPPTRYRGFFIMPPLALLLTKLQSWHNNNISHESTRQGKTTTDIIDIRAILEEVVKIQQTLRARNQSWFPPWFVEQGEKHTKEFLVSNPSLSHDAAELRRWVHSGLIDGLQGLEIQRKSAKAVNLVRYIQNYLDTNFKDDADAGPAREYLIDFLTGSSRFPGPATSLPMASIGSVTTGVRTWTMYLP